MEIDDMIKSDKEFSLGTLGQKQESRALANAMKALQQKIRDLEGENENLTNHVRYLQESRDFSENRPNSSRAFTGAVQELQEMRERLCRVEEEKLLQWNKADFFEKELKRKEQQFQIDRDTWDLEKMTLKKSLESKRAQINSPRKSRKSPKHSTLLNKLEEANHRLLEELNSLKSSSRLNESRLAEAEEIISRLHEEHDRNLQALENEIYMIKESPCANCPKLQAEVDSLREVCDSQKSRIEALCFEVESWKNNGKKIEGITNCINNFNKTEVLGGRESNYQGSTKDLEDEVNRLSKKYKSLLDRTKKQDENYPELRSELKQTAFELEVQSFNLYQIKKIEHDQIYKE